MPAKPNQAAASRGGECERMSARKAIVRLAALAAIVLAGDASAEASITPAGTLISNTAYVSFELSGVASTVATNAADTLVDELVSFSVSDTGGPTTGGAGFNVSNTGNGCQSPSLSLLTDVDPASVTIAIDIDGDGVFDPARDTVYTGGNGPLLCPGDIVTVFVILNIDPTTTAGDVDVSVTVGGGAPGVRPGMGYGGGDVVVTSSKTSRTVSLTSHDTLNVSLVKTQEVVGDIAATSVNAGDIISYTLRAIATGAGLVENAILSDPLPAGLVYVPGSLTIDGAALSDDADGDVAEAAANLITVRLPTAAAPFDRIITFRARVLDAQ